MSRDITMKEQVFASGALTEIPIPPIAGTPYRKPLASDGEIKPGWKYRDVVDSAAFNEVMYRTTSLVNQLEKDGILIWSNKTNYPEGGIAKGPTDGKLYQAVQASGPGTLAGFKDCEEEGSEYWGRYNDIDAHNQDPNAHGGQYGERGFILSNGADEDNDIDISAGNIADSTYSNFMTLDSVFTKQIDADWAPGSDAGGFPSNLTLSANTWYHLFVIYNPTTNNTDAGFDTSTTAANLLTDATGYTKYRRLGSVLTENDSKIRGFKQSGNHIHWDMVVLDHNPSLFDNEALIAVSVPPLDKITANVAIIPYSNGSYIFKHPDTPIQPSQGYGVGPFTYVDGATDVIIDRTLIPTNNSRFRTTTNAGSANYYICTIGWIDHNLKG